MTLYTVPLIGSGSREDAFRPAYADLLGSWKRVAKGDATITVQSFNPETQLPCDAPGHADLAVMSDVTVAAEP